MKFLSLGIIVPGERPDYKVALCKLEECIIVRDGCSQYGCSTNGPSCFCSGGFTN